MVCSPIFCMRLSGLKVGPRSASVCLLPFVPPFLENP